MIRFLWVVFQIDSICAQNSDHDILRSLEDLPQGLPATFRRILRHLQDSAVANPRLASKILEIVAGAQRPLNLDELEEAMSITPGNTSWDSSKLINDVPKLLECCGSLLVVDEEFSTIHFAHSSVKEHLVSKPTDLDIVEYHIDLERADNDLGKLCVTYLNLDVFSSPLTKPNTQSPSYAANLPATVVQSTLSKHESIKRVALAMLKGRRTLKNDSNIDFQQSLGTIHREDPKMKNDFHFLPYCQEHWLHHSKAIHHFKNDQAYKLWERLVNESVTTVDLPWAPERLSSGGELLMNWLRINRHIPLLKEIFQQLWNSRELQAAIFDDSPASKEMNTDRLEELLGLLPDEDERRDVGLIFHSRINLFRADAKSDNASRLFLSWISDILDEAVCKEHELLVQLLLQPDVNTTIHPESLASALHHAISNCNKNMVTLLVDHGADINHSDEYHGTALHAAALISDDNSILELLIKKGADVNARGGKYGTALIAAASAHNLRAIEQLVDAGADVNVSHEEYGTALITSMSGFGSSQITTLLLGKGADVNARGGKYGTALIKAVAYENLHAVEQLVVAGADINASHEKNSTALDLSIKREYFNKKIFDRLISGGAAVSYRAPAHDSPLVSAVKFNCAYAVTKLLEAGADPGLGGETLSSLLKIAAKKKGMWIVKALLDHDLYAATKELELGDTREYEKSIKEVMRVLETDESIARFICMAHANKKLLGLDTKVVNQGVFRH